MTTLSEKLRSLACLLWIAPLVAVAGCGSSEANFRLNLVHAQVASDKGDEITPEQMEFVANTLGGLFGTPDQPLVYDDAGFQLSKTLDLSLLQMAAGPVGRNKLGVVQGLYRVHCVHCHGITGDGAGPTAPFLNPYPRDYRRGTFKFTSTPVGEAPTDEDLQRILTNGIPGTAMPSFRLLDSDEQDALIQYVKYLSIRGETERILLDLAAQGELTPDLEPEVLHEWVIGDTLARVVDKWNRAEEAATPVPTKPEWTGKAKDDAIVAGRELFFGTVANCVKCHGDTQLGDGQTSDFDAWTKDMSDKPQDLIDKEPGKLAEFLALGALEPRTIRPRNLRQGVYRGGRRPVDLYWRIYNGINGTPMPAAPKEVPSSPTSPFLSEEQIWQLIEYVQHLPYENLSTPGGTHQVENMRERN